MNTQHGIVSAWNWGTGRWDHYRLPPWAKQSYGALPKQRSPLPQGQLGTPPEDSELPFPFGARLVGSSDRAEGQIVQSPGGRLGTVALLGVAGLLLWLWWGREERAT